MKKLNLLLFPFLIIISLLSCVTKKTKEQPFFDHTAFNFELKTIEAQIDTLIGARKYNLKVSYYPEEDVVCVEYRYNSISFYQYWDFDNRKIFLDALEEYLKDFEERNLNTRAGRRTIGQYGTMSLYINWQAQAFTVRASGHAKTVIGYIFKDRSPYFALRQWRTLYEDPHYAENNKASDEVIMLFTRAQAQELAELFDSEYLAGAASEQQLPGRRVTTTDADMDEW